LFRNCIRALGAMLSSTTRCTATQEKKAKYKDPGTLECRMNPQRVQGGRTLKDGLSNRDLVSAGKEVMAESSNFIEVVIELPHGSIDNPRRVFRIPSDATAGALANSLADQFRVTRGLWRLHGSVNEKKYSAHVLDKNAQMNVYGRDISPNASLYFYPKMRM